MPQVEFGRTTARIWPGRRQPCPQDHLAGWGAQLINTAPGQLFPGPAEERGQHDIGIQHTAVALQDQAIEGNVGELAKAHHCLRGVPRRVPPQMGGGKAKAMHHRGRNDGLDDTTHIDLPRNYS